MSQTDLLRERYEQHKPKNNKSKYTDKKIYRAMNAVIDYLQKRFENMLDGYEIVFEKHIEIEYMIKFIRSKGIRNEFDFDYIDRKIITFDKNGTIVFHKKLDNKTLISLNISKNTMLKPHRLKDKKVLSNFEILRDNYL